MLIIGTKFNIHKDFVKFFSFSIRHTPLDRRDGLEAQCPKRGFRSV